MVLPLNTFPPKPPLCLKLAVRGSFGVVYTGTVVDKPSVKVVIKDQEVKDPRSIEDWQQEIGVMQYVALGLGLGLGFGLRGGLGRGQVLGLGSYYRKGG